MSERQHSYQFYTQNDSFYKQKRAQKIIDELKSRCRRNLPDDLRVATVWYKPTKSETGRVPDFYIHETDQWLVFPHELQGLTIDEVQAGKPEIADIVKGL